MNEVTLDDHGFSGPPHTSFREGFLGLCRHCLSWSTMTAEASVLSDGMSHRKSKVAATATDNCAATNPTTSAGLTPANVLLADRATVTAGLAKDVDAVNQ
jgi:hypothetical protein